MSKLLAHLRGAKKDLLAKIRKEKALTDEIETEIKSTLSDFAKSFA